MRKRFYHVLQFDCPTEKWIDDSSSMDWGDVYKRKHLLMKQYGYLPESFRIIQRFFYYFPTDEVTNYDDINASYWYS